jgi:hypothetical protein
MTDKTEDQIAREKEAVQKMIGAKGAMETAIARINRLENAIEGMVRLIDDLKQACGEKAMFSTYHHGENRSDGPKAVFVRQQLARIAQIGRDVK